MPYTARGIQFSRTWVVSESPDILRARWRELVAAPAANRADLMKASRDATPDGNYGSFLSGARLPRLDTLGAGSEPDGIRKFGYRSFDPQWCIADRRVVDLPRPALWRSHGPEQVYLSFLPGQTVSGPAVIAHAHVPDLNATIGSNGGLVLPFYLEPGGMSPNIHPELLAALGLAYGRDVADREVWQYLFGILGTGAYTAAFADELPNQQGLPVPLTANPELFGRASALGAELLWWGTFAERSQPVVDGRALTRLPVGTARATRAVPTAAGQHPDRYDYDREAQVLRVGDGEFAPVTSEVWDFDVSGMRVVASWLDYRLRKRAGRTSSPLDSVRPLGWTYSMALVELLAVVERFVLAETDAALLLAEIVDGDLLDLTLAPAVPAARRRRRVGHEQTALDL
jgi:hypothetical protein